MTTQAYAYLRVSSKGQVEGDGLPRQRDAIAAYARAHSIDLTAEFRDEGVSGTNELEDRPGLAALLDAVESNGVRMVIVERADRLARDLIVGEVILGQFRTAGVQVWTAEGGIDLTVTDDDPTRKLIRQILGAVAEFDKAVLVLKLRAARQRIRRETGRCEGVKPYGTLPGEADVVALIHQLRRKPRGEPRPSYGRVARILNERGCPARHGGHWTACTVRRIALRR